MKSHYISIIREQENMIKQLKIYNNLYLLVGFSLGVFISILTFILLK